MSRKRLFPRIREQLAEIWWIGLKTWKAKLCLFKAMTEIRLLGNDAAHVKAKDYNTIGQGEIEYEALLENLQMYKRKMVVRVVLYKERSSFRWLLAATRPSYSSETQPFSEPNNLTDHFR